MYNNSNSDSVCVCVCLASEGRGKSVETPKGDEDPAAPALMMIQMVHLKMFTMRTTNHAAKYRMCRDRD